MEFIAKVLVRILRQSIHDFYDYFYVMSLLYRPKLAVYKRDILQYFVFRLVKYESIADISGLCDLIDAALNIAGRSRTIASYRRAAAYFAFALFDALA